MKLVGLPLSLPLPLRFTAVRAAGASRKPLVCGVATPGAVAAAGGRVTAAREPEPPLTLAMLARRISEVTRGTSALTTSAMVGRRAGSRAQHAFMRFT
jgi:hypothetical protein